MAGQTTEISADEVRRLQKQNAEMRRLLAIHQWSGLAPLKSRGVCPECCGSSRNGHRPGCALEAALTP